MHTMVVLGQAGSSAAGAVSVRLRDAKVTVVDWNCFMSQIPTHVQDLSPFVI